jgi:hypothetical protein
MGMKTFNKAQSPPSGAMQVTIISRRKEGEMWVGLETVTLMRVAKVGTRILPRDKRYKTKHSQGPEDG